MVRYGENSFVISTPPFMVDGSCGTGQSGEWLDSRRLGNDKAIACAQADMKKQDNRSKTTGQRQYFNVGFLTPGSGRCCGSAVSRFSGCRHFSGRKPFGTRPTNQSINQLTDQLTDQSIDQSTVQLGVSGFASLAGSWTNGVASRSTRPTEQDNRACWHVS
jgi:hypothetical protein